MGGQFFMGVVEEREGWVGKVSRFFSHFSLSSPPPHPFFAVWEGGGRGLASPFFPFQIRRPGVGRERELNRLGAKSYTAPFPPHYPTL